MESVGRGWWEMTRRRAASGKNAQASDAGEETGPDPKGLKKLSEEADKTLGEEGDVIADALSTEAKKGNIACAQLLVDLAERKGRRKRVPRPKKAGESLATQLALEPEWPLRPRPAKKDAIETKPEG